MAASSDGQRAIEVVIEKLQEIVDDIQKTEDVPSGRPQNKNEPEKDNLGHDISPKVKVERLDANGTRYARSGDSATVQNSTQINIVPIALGSPKSERKKSYSHNPAPTKGTSIVITTTKDNNPSQVVLNFPVDAGEFNIGNTQGLIETLQKLNSVLTKGRELGQKSLFTTSNGGQFTTEVQLYKCAKCDYWSHNKYYLKQHVDLVHNAERVYKCPFCDYAGKRSHSLKEHLVVHSNYRPYVCSQCNASFRKKGHLTNHVKMHSQYKGNGNPVCPICVKSNFENLLALHIHLRETHPSEVYSCDICQYATFLNKGNITMHMLTHGNPKVYTCSACNFTALHQRIMEEHILEEHIVDAQGSSENGKKLNALKVVQERVQVQDGSSQSEAPKIWLKCTECGFSTTERDTLHDHMIAKHLNIQETLVEPQNSEATSTSNAGNPDGSTSNTTDSGSLPVGNDARQYTEFQQLRKVIEGSPPYKCWHCNYETDATFIFITHMLKHRTSQESASKSGGAIHSVTAQQLANVQKVQRKSGATPDPPAATQPYMYDECNKWYQCTLCGYSSEHQRTIKAHIWKHSGHKDLDYPMFQSGPSSIFDEDSTSSLASRVSQTVSCVSTSAAIAKSTDFQPTTMTPVRSNPVETSSQDSSQQGSKKDYIVVRISNRELIAGEPVDDQIKNIVQQLDVVPDEVVIYDPEHEEEIKTDAEPPVKKIKQESPSPIKRVIVEPVERELVVSTSSKNVGPSGENEDNAVDSFDIPIKFISSQDMQENIPPSIGATRAVYATAKGPIIVRAHHLSPGQFSPSKAPDMAVEVSVQSQEDLSTEETDMDIDVGNEVDIQEETALKAEPENHAFIPTVVASQSETSSAVASITQPISEDMSATHFGLPEMAVEVSVSCSGSVVTRPSRLPLDTDASQDDDDTTDDDSSQISSSYDSSDAEIVTLLTLLKKGSNFNASGHGQDRARLQGLANAVRQRVQQARAEAATAGEGEDAKTAGGGGASGGAGGAGGISSSLLAVIEQLRERTNSVSADPQDGDKEKETTGGVSGASGRRRKRRRAEEDFEKLLNIEAVDEGGYRCLQCLYTHDSLDNVRAHMRIHEASASAAARSAQCSLCDFAASGSAELQEHMLQHCKTRTFQCKKCSAVFNYKSQLRAHMLAHEDAKVFPCHLCEFACHDMNSLLEHCKHHDADNKQVYMCKLCESPFNSYEEITHHVQSCNNTRSATATGVGIVGTNEAGMDGSVSGQGGGGGGLLGNKSRTCRREYTCDYCPFVANTQVLLKAHTRSHDQDQNLRCTTCGFEAYSIRSLKSHMKRHVNDQRFVEQPLEQYKCNLCGYVCHHLPSLKSHMWRHASDKNYNYELINEIINRALEYDEATAKQSLVAAAAAAAVRGAADGSGDDEGEDTLQPNYLILFRCCQCGYESVHKSLLNAHMKTHRDIIEKTLEVNEDRLLPQKTRPAPATGRRAAALAATPALTPVDTQEVSALVRASRARAVTATPQGVALKSRSSSANAGLVAPKFVKTIIVKKS